MKNKTLPIMLVLTILAGLIAGQVLADSALRFHKYSCQDRSGLQTEAFSLLIPAQWSFDGGIAWNTANPVSPAMVAFKVTSPDKRQALEFFPNRKFYWTDDASVQAMFPPGSEYIGSEVCPPMSAEDYVRNIIIPRYRPGIAGLAEIESGPLPDFARDLSEEIRTQQGLETFTDGARVAVTYSENGRSVEEEFYVIILGWAFSTPTMYGAVSHYQWSAEYQFSFKTEKGRMTRSARIFQTMINSFRINPDWFNRYVQLVDYLAQNQVQQIQNIGQISNMISRTSNDISDMMMDSYNRRQAVYDRMGDRFSQSTRGVDSYYDPTESRAVELPTGYDNAWSNGLGEYIVSDQADFDPNRDSGVNWQRLERR